MDQPWRAGMAGRLNHIQGAGNIAALEPFGIRCIDHAGDMNDRFRAVTQAAERGVIIQIAAHPFHPLTNRLLATGQCTDRNAGFRGAIEQGLANKAGSPRHGYRHSTTIWSRWTTAERGA